jgi:serine/threonine protein kinase/tetratricopeptide (TPR) repeat protein
MAYLVHRCLCFYSSGAVRIGGSVGTTSAMTESQDALKMPPVVHELTGTIVGRFAIREKLGAGGMGQVYRAEDKILKRVVAIKRMAPKWQFQERDRERFLKEAQRASSLNHPNIAAIYDVLEDKGEILLVMEHVEGVTLRQRMTEPISINEFLDAAIQCAEGLGAAHERSIMHGDIKPENIMLTSAKRVKILDFGVAKRLAHSETGNEMTESVASMTVSLSGTPAYMAPEVLMQKPYDERADLFSLGLVFYEMLGGRQPFRSDNFAGTLDRVLHAEVPPLSEINGQVPAPLEGLVARMLMKDPRVRHSSATTVLADLRTIQRGGTTVVAQVGKRRRPKWAIQCAIVTVVIAVSFIAYRPVQRLWQSRGEKIEGTTQALPRTEILAVLPFPVIEGNPKLTALGQGLVETVSAKLGRLTEDRAFEVIPARNLQERSVTTLADARRQFGANLGLVVTLEESGELIRVSYTLLNAENGRAVGGDSMAVPAGDAFAVEDDVAQGTVKALQLKLRPEEQAALNVHGTDQPAAYKYFLQARGYLLDYVKTENVENAIVMVREALKLDPNFGMAKAALGEAYWRKYWLSKQKQWTELAKRECDSAVKLGNAGAAGHACLGLVNDGTGHYREAAVEFQRAIDLEPTNEDAYIGLALAFEHRGAINEAEKAYQRAIESHPNSRYGYNSLGTFYLRRNEYEKALRMFQKVIELAPEGYGAYVNLGATYSNMGRYAEAIEPLKRSIVIRPSYPAYVNLGTAYFGLNKFADAVAAYEEALKLNPRQYVTWGNLADAHYYSGQKKEAMPAYRNAVQLASEELKVNPHDPDVLSSIATYYSVLGDREHALLYLGQALEYGHNDKDTLLDAASVYNNLGQTGMAVEWLGRAVQAGYPTTKIRDLQEFRNLQNNPGYQQLMGK